MLFAISDNAIIAGGAFITVFIVVSLLKQIADKGKAKQDGERKCPACAEFI